jgi:hypothetical protein
VTDTERSPAVERRARAWLSAGAGIALAGLALTGTGNRAFGGVVLLVGWGCLITAIHRFGRLGASA